MTTLTTIVEPAGEDSGNVDQSRDSRLVGALGRAALDRLRSLSYAIVGVSRAGSLMAHSLARLGVRHIKLIDPDVVEPHNADCGEFHPEFDEGRKKVQVIAKAIRHLMPPGSYVEVFDQSLLALLPFSAVRSSEIIITCVDDDGARLVASLLANSFLRPHLDIGTQITRNEQGVLSAGADIRLLLPTDPPQCLNCFGGFAQHDALRRLVGVDKSPTPAWDSMRAGSLRSVNQIATHTGLRLIERLVSGEIKNSTWLRYEDNPLPGLREIVPQRPWSCPVCSTSHGIGDAIFTDCDVRLRRIVKALRL